jgi:hypothetical protein
MYLACRPSSLVCVFQVCWKLPLCQLVLRVLVFPHIPSFLFHLTVLLWAHVYFPSLFHHNIEPPVNPVGISHQQMFSSFISDCVVVFFDSCMRMNVCVVRAQSCSNRLFVQACEVWLLPSPFSACWHLVTFCVKPGHLHELGRFVACLCVRTGEGSGGGGGFAQSHSTMYYSSLIMRCVDT